MPWSVVKKDDDANHKSSSKGSNEATCKALVASWRDGRASITKAFVVVVVVVVVVVKASEARIVQLVVLKRMMTETRGRKGKRQDVVVKRQKEAPL